MLSLGVLVFLIGAVSAGSPITRPKQEIEEFKAFLEAARKDDGSLERMAANPLAKPWEKSGKSQGDILLDDDQAEYLLEYALGRSVVWPNTKLPSDNIVQEFGADEYILRNTNGDSVATATMMMGKHQR